MINESNSQKLDELEERELDFKLHVIKDFLIKRGGYKVKLYNRTCPEFCDTPDSNIIEYFDDIVYFINKMKG